MERYKYVAIQADTMITLKEMRNYLTEWFANELKEEIVNIDYQGYKKALLIKDDANQSVFYAPFRADETISDSSKVFLSGIANNELRELIQKCIELDEQIAEARKPKQTLISSQPIKIG